MKQTNFNKIEIRNTIYERIIDLDTQTVTYWSIDEYGKNKVCPAMIVNEMVYTGIDKKIILNYNMPEIKNFIKMNYIGEI